MVMIITVSWINLSEQQHSSSSSSDPLTSMRGCRMLVVSVESDVVQMYV